MNDRQNLDNDIIIGNKEKLEQELIQSQSGNKYQQFIKVHPFYFALLIVGCVALISAIVVVNLVILKDTKHDIIVLIKNTKYEIIDKYIDELIKFSTPEKPLWNIELIKMGKKPSWNYIDGCMMESLIELYKQTNKRKYLDFVINYTDYFVKDNGTIEAYNYAKHTLDDIAESRILFDLYNFTENEKYIKAIENTYKQILDQPRTYEGNFWHKEVYPNQVWLDGLYMAQVFYMRYEIEIDGMKNYKDIRNQFEIVHNRMRDENKHLYYHGYDASKSIFWADKTTGLSKSFWLRSIGWYVMALVDICDYMSQQTDEDYTFYGDLLKETLDGILEYQDKNSKMFWQVVDQGDREGNYVETSGSCMIAYGLLKGARLGILPSYYQDLGLEVFDGICDKYLSEKNGELNLGGICLQGGLGPENKKYKNGTFEYYISEEVVENDAKGVGPLIMAYTEVKKVIR